MTELIDPWESAGLPIPYNPDRHLDQIKEWVKQWELPESSIDLLPQTGLIIPGKGAIFVYFTNSKLCFLDFFITNKILSREEREKNLTLLCDQIMDEIRLNGHYPYVAAYSSNPKVVAQGIKRGFNLNKETYQCFVRAL